MLVSEKAPYIKYQVQVMTQGAEDGGFSTDEIEELIVEIRQACFCRY